MELHSSSAPKRMHRASCGDLPASEGNAGGHRVSCGELCDRPVPKGLDPKGPEPPRNGLELQRFQKWSRENLKILVLGVQRVKR